MRDQMAFYRTLPKRSGNYKGTAKSAVKFTTDVIVDGVDGSSITAPLILELSISCPVGVSDATILAARQRVVSVADLDAVIGPLTEDLEI
jgi:hypothetical protein